MDYSTVCNTPCFQMNQLPNQSFQVAPQKLHMLAILSHKKKIWNAWTATKPKWL